MDGSRDAELFHIQLERHGGEVPIRGCGAVGLLVAAVGSASVGTQAVVATADIVLCHYVTLGDLYLFVTSCCSADAALVPTK